MLIRKVAAWVLCVSVVSGVLASGSSWARPLTPQEKAADLEHLFTSVRSGYGPLRFKAEAIRLDMEGLRTRYLEKAAATRNNAEFYYLINQLIAEFQDSHFSGRVPSKLTASLPFSVDLIAGKVLIDTIDRKLVTEAEFPFERGDEVLAWDGRPVAEVVAELQSFRGAGYEATARRRAAMSLTVRPGTDYPVPAGEVTVRIRRGDSELSDEVKLKWVRKGNPLDEVQPAVPLSGGLSGVGSRDFDDLSLLADWEALETGRTERSFRCAGTTRIEIPKDATRIMDAPFVAYYHATPKGNVGYLRIPHYAPEGEYELRFHQYEYAVSVLEKNTVGLIIDQDHNCGGSVEWLHRIAGLFLDKPFRPMQFQLLANKQEYLEFDSWATGVPENTLGRVNLMKVLGLIKSAWEKGEFMTPMTSITGEEWVQPHSIRYTKPIVMLIDELSGSGGDAFPAMLQGNGRAKLLGTRTMGAGGHVEEQPDLPHSRVHFRMTKSLFYRPDGQAVENRGAEPDVAYTPTRTDFLFGYRAYQAFYLNELSKLLN